MQYLDFITIYRYRGSIWTRRSSIVFSPLRYSFFFGPCKFPHVGFFWASKFPQFDSKFEIYKIPSNFRKITFEGSKAFFISKKRKFPQNLPQTFPDFGTFSKFLQFCIPIFSSKKTIHGGTHMAAKGVPRRQNNGSDLYSLAGWIHWLWIRLWCSFISTPQLGRNIPQDVICRWWTNWTSALLGTSSPKLETFPGICWSSAGFSVSSIMIISSCV